MSYISVENVHKNYNNAHILRGVNLSIGASQVACLIGPSGCGKSTLLRCINGLERIDAGTIRVGDIVVSDDRSDSTALCRRVGFVFQHFNLFPHMTALDNVTLGPRCALRMNRRDAENEALSLLEKVGLVEKARRYPDALSGGEQQRVAIARALAMRPDALLLDEITSALDPELVGGVLKIVQRLAEEGMTMILATHEMGFAREVADTVCFVFDGVIYESAEPDILFAHPERPRTRAFLDRLAEAKRL